jgi:hypothetical protein
MAGESPFINGHRYSFGSIELVVLQTKIFGITAISYGSSLKPGVVRGTDAQEVGRTPGEASHRCELEMYQHEFDYLVGKLGPGFGLVPFDVSVTFAEEHAAVKDGGEPEGVRTHEINGCRITDVDMQSGEGVEPNKVRLQLHPRSISYGPPSNMTIEWRDPALVALTLEEEAL